MQNDSKNKQWGMMEWVKMDKSSPQLNGLIGQYSSTTTNHRAEYKLT